MALGILLRGLMDNNLLNTPHGQAAMGWLVMEDILSVLILVLMPALASSTNGGFNATALLLTLLKAAAFGLIMFFIGARVIPWTLDRIAHTRSRELFILAILAITLGVAVGQRPAQRAAAALLPGHRAGQRWLLHLPGAGWQQHRHGISSGVPASHRVVQPPPANA